MRFLLVILCLVSFFLLPGQYAVGQVNLINTGWLRTHNLQTSEGKIQPVLDGNFPLNLLVFLSPECPLSINYTKTLNSLAEQFSGKANIIGIIPGRSYSLGQADSFARDYKLRFPVFIDTDKKITGLVKATITPEVILFDRKGEIIYRGAIDDWAVDLGKKKISATDPYLGNAITAHLAGNQVVLKRTRPVGCLINDL